METETGLRDEGVVNDVALQVQERPQAPQRSVNGRKKNKATTLPASLGSLRPASLPNISSIHSPPLNSATPRFAEAEMVRSSQVNGATPVPTSIEEEEEEEELDPREAEILRLVAASTPSHRAAWKKDSRAWQLFVSRQGRKFGDRSILEEDEDEDLSTTESSKDYPDDSDVDDETIGISESKSKRSTFCDISKLAYLLLICYYTIRWTMVILREPHCFFAPYTYQLQITNRVKSGCAIVQTQDIPFR